MDLQETGKLIAERRKESGYTQSALARLLHVTDKAVSKWERGICLPDSALLTRLSMLLDVDVDYLISGSSPYGKNQWRGEIRADSVRGEIAGRPLIFYLLSYFLLVGICDISIITNDTEYIRSLHLEQYGLKISFSRIISEKTMMISNRFLLFGVNLTRQFQYCMACESSIALQLHGISLPIIFSHWGVGNSDTYNYENAEKKPLGRGTIYIPLNTEKNLEDASAFVKIYEQYTKKHIADLEEIAKLRGLV